MHIIESNRVKCKFCLQILKQEEIDKNGIICNECCSIIYKIPDLNHKMDQHILNVKNFENKYSPMEVSLEEAIEFLERTYNNESNSLLNKSSTDFRFLEMDKSGIKISGNILIASFIPRVVEIVHYSALRKVRGISLASNRDKNFLRKYWLEHYGFELSYDWDYVIQISFIQRKKTQYEEKIYDFPSCVIEKFYTINNAKPIPEVFSQVLSTEEFCTKETEFSLLIDLNNFELLSNGSNIPVPLVNSVIIATKRQPYVNAMEQYDPDQKIHENQLFKNNFYYYNKNDEFIAIISYYEVEFLIMNYLIYYMLKKHGLPPSVKVYKKKKAKSKKCLLY